MPLINRREAPQIFGSLSSVFLKKVGDLIKKRISKALYFKSLEIPRVYYIQVEDYSYQKA